MDGLDAAFADAFSQPQNNHSPQQEPQHQPQCQCCANQHCQFQGMAVGGTLHYCQCCGGTYNARSVRAGDTSTRWYGYN